MMTTVRAFFAEMRRRRVYRVAAVYLIIAWGLLQLGDVVVEPLLLPDWTMTLIIVLLGLGFPLALLLAWAYEITPDGVRRTGPRETATAASRASARPSPATALGGRAAGWVGVGILIGIFGVGWYAYVGPERPAPGTLATADAASLRSIAVLPFANTSPDAENEFFADGVTDDILTHLAVVPSFSVISRTTAMRYKGSDRSAPEIAAELGVRYVLEGNVRRAGERVRITARLVDGPSDQQLWAQTFDRDLRDIFAVQTEIARAIAGALEAELSSGVAARIERRPTASLEAYDLFLRGRDNFYRYDRPGVERAIAAFRDALALDPDFALARAWLGRAYAIYAFNMGAGPAWGDSALAQARRAVAQQPDLADAHTALGTALATAGRYADAIPVLERASQLNPNDWSAIANLGLIYILVGRHDDGVRETRRSLERDPARSFLALGNMGSAYLQVGMYDDARRALERALEVNPGYGQSIFLMGWLDWRDGRLDQARAAAARLEATGEPRQALDVGFLRILLGDLEGARDALARSYAGTPTAIGQHLVGVLYGHTLLATGEPARAREILAETERYARAAIEAGDERRSFPYSLASLHAVRGETDEAIRWLERAVDQGWTSAGLDLDPTLASLHGDPRFEAIVRRAEAAAATRRARIEREGW